MGGICCKNNAIEGNDASESAASKYQYLEQTESTAATGKHYVFTNSMDRSTWFSEQLDKPGDEEFFSQKINLCDFKIKNLVGHGNYSKVFLVHRVGTKQPYAMKVIKKTDVENDEVKKRALIERDIMQFSDSPFIVKLHYSFQTPQKLYFILDFVNGGELYSKLMQKHKLDEKTTKFYAAEILLALKHLHERRVLYRDLKPRNIMLDKEGHIKLIDFGLCKVDYDKPDTEKRICGTPHYVSPDMLRGDKHNQMMDYWSLGVLVYEMLHGKFPFAKFEQDSTKIFEQIRDTPLKVSNKVSPFAKDFLTRLLDKDPSKRLGAKGISEIMDHFFFEEIDWLKLERKQIKPPYVPKLKKEDDVKYFSEHFIDQDVESSPDTRILSRQEKEEKHVHNFTFIGEDSFLSLSKCDPTEETDIDAF